MTDVSMIRQFLEGAPVAELTGEEFSGLADRKSIVHAVRELYSVFNYESVNPEIGKVRLTKSGINDSMRHGYGREKLSAFAAVPKIVEKGMLVVENTDWKARGYQSFVLAAPISIAGEPYFALVVVNRMQNGDQNFYLHEVGRISDIKNTAEGLRSGLVTADDKVDPSFGSMKSIALSVFRVNRESVNPQIGETGRNS